MFKKNIIFVFLQLFFLLGCNQGQNTVTNTKTLQGNEGLKMEIIAKNIPENAYENEDLDMVIKLTNKGAYDIPAADSVLKITLERGYLAFVGGDHLVTDSFALVGKERFTRVDDIMLKEYRFITGVLDEQSKVHTSLILASACYNYLTKAYADVCIDTDIYNIKPIDKVCSAKPVSLSGGQGAPVAVTGVEPRMLANGDYIRPQFTITIKNVDEGSVIEYNKINTVCSSSSLTRDDYNTIDLVELRFSDFTINDFTCEPTRDGRFVAKLKNEEDKIVCTLGENLLPKSTVTYETPLYIELRYGYTLSKSTQVTINKVPT
ncbi:MAG: hypothetical protein V1859_04890 [archaeon]